MINAWQARAKLFKRELHALTLAMRDPRTPWYARALGVLVIAYATSPIDLIPDFIPVLGYLDDLILVPAGIALTLRLVPAQVLEEARAKVDAHAATGKPVNWVAAVVIVALWLGAGVWIGLLIWRTVGG